MKANVLNTLLEVGTEFLKEATVYLRHQRETYDAQLKALDEEKKMLEQMMAPRVSRDDNGIQLKPVDIKALFGGGDGK